MIKEQQDLSLLVRNFEESNRQDLINRRKKTIDRIKKRKRKGKIVSLRVPELGNLKKCQVNKWYFQIGDIITDSDVICTIKYDKATLEIASEYNCRLISVQEIDTILSQGKELCVIEKY